MNLLSGVLCGSLAFGGGLLLGRSNRTGSEKDFAWGVACLVSCVLLIFSLSAG